MSPYHPCIFHKLILIKSMPWLPFLVNTVFFSKQVKRVRQNGVSWLGANGPGKFLKHFRNLIIIYGQALPAQVNLVGVFKYQPMSASLHFL